MAKKSKFNWWRIYGQLKARKAWNAIGIYRAEEMGLWAAYGYGPNEYTLHWTSQGVRHPEAVEKWMAGEDIGVELQPWHEDVSASLDWEGAGFSHAEARAWRAAGFYIVDEAILWMKLGLDNPQVNRQWREAGFTRASAVKLIAKGYRVERAEAIREAGVPIGFLVYVHADRWMPTERALAWAYCDLGMDYRLRAAFATTDYDLDDVEELSDLGFEAQELEAMFFGPRAQPHEAIALARKTSEMGHDELSWAAICEMAEALGLEI